MGAHAAVLAAADHPRVRVLVLDSIYPEPSFRLVRDVYARWGFAVRNLSFLPRVAFSLLHGATLDERGAAAELNRMTGRHLLLLAPAGDSMLAAEMQSMWKTIPEDEDADGNLVTLPATQPDGLYGVQLQRYHERVAAFFLERLPVDDI